MAILTVGNIIKAKNKLKSNITHYKSIRGSAEGHVQLMSSQSFVLCTNHHSPTPLTTQQPLFKTQPDFQIILKEKSRIQKQIKQLTDSIYIFGDVLPSSGDARLM
jgi:hypothetical protein